MINVISIPNQSGDKAGVRRSKSDSRWNETSKTSRQKNIQSPTMPHHAKASKKVSEGHSSSDDGEGRWNHRNKSIESPIMPLHKSIKVPAAHSRKESEDCDYVRRRVKQDKKRSSSRSLDRSGHGKPSRSSRSLDRSGHGKPSSRKSRSSSRSLDKSGHGKQSKSRSSRSLDKSGHGKPSKSRSSRSLDRSQTSPSDQPVKRRVRKLVQTTRSKSSRDDLMSPGARGNGSGRKEPEKRGVLRSKSSRIENEDPLSPEILSSSNRSECSNLSGSSRTPMRRSRRTRSLDASTRSLSRDDYILTKSGHKRSVERENSESDATETTCSCTTASSTIGQLRTPKTQMRSNSDISKLSTSSRSFTSLSSHNCSTPGRNRIQNNPNSPNSLDGLKRVSWKADPKTSFSDWTLQVTYRDSNHKRQTDTYHLHKNVVAYGTRKSNSVLRDIMDNEMKMKFDFANASELELKTLLARDQNVTKLKLTNEKQAQAVPLVLNFMYYDHDETSGRMSAERSCNVFKVAEGLKVRALQNSIAKFYEKNLSVHNMEEFLKSATNTKADMLLATCKAKIRQMIAKEPGVLESIPEEYLPNIMDHSGHSHRSYLLDSSNRSGTQKTTNAFPDDFSSSPADSDIDDFSV